MKVTLTPICPTAVFLATSSSTDSVLFSVCVTFVAAKETCMLTDVHLNIYIVSLYKLIVYRMYLQTMCQLLCDSDIGTLYHHFAKKVSLM